MARYEEIVKVSQRLDTQAWLYTHATCEKYAQKRSTMCITTIFCDGTQMDIRCCHRKDTASICEAILFGKNGRPVDYRAYGREFEGLWEIEHNGNVYAARVEVDTPYTNEHKSGIIITDKNNPAPVIMAMPTNPRVNADNIYICIRNSLTAHYQRNPEGYDKKKFYDMIAEHVGHQANEWHNQYGFALFKLADSNEEYWKIMPWPAPIVDIPCDAQPVKTADIAKIKKTIPHQSVSLRCGIVFLFNLTRIWARASSSRNPPETLRIPARR